MYFLSVSLKPSVCALWVSLRPAVTSPCSACSGLAAHEHPEHHLWGQRTSKSCCGSPFSPSQQVWGVFFFFFFLFLHRTSFLVLCVLSICCGLTVGDGRGAAEGAKGALYVLSLHQCSQRWEGTVLPPGRWYNNSFPSAPIYIWTQRKASFL